MTQNTDAGSGAIAFAVMVAIAAGLAALLFLSSTLGSLADKMDITPDVGTEES